MFHGFFNSLLERIAKDAMHVGGADVTDASDDR
jgi:hypothetical protein